MRLSEQKKVIRSFMQAQYSDERLAMLLAFAQDGGLLFKSCCCFIGIPTADHALSAEVGYGAAHYQVARKVPGATVAEDAYRLLGKHGRDWDATRRRILIPMIRAEMKRREKLRALDSVKVSSEPEVLA